MVSLRLILLAGAVFASSGVGAEDELADKRVVVLHSYHYGFTWTDEISQGIEDALAPHRDSIELCYEYMDARRISTHEHLAELARLYQEKYAGRKVDVVVASDDHAFAFLLDQGRHLFEDAPVVFLSVSGYEPSMRAVRPLTGIEEDLGLGETLDLALRLHPDTRRVNVVLDQSRTGQALRRKAEAAFAPQADRVAIRYLDDLGLDELRETLAALENGEIVFLFVFPREETGRVLSHEENLRKIGPECRVPIYSAWSFYLGSGIVGGQLTVGREDGRAAAEMALRILRGERPEDVAVQRSQTLPMFDHEQLARFGVAESLLPPGSIIINRPHSLYEQHTVLVWSVILTILLLVGLVTHLGVSVTRQHRAEHELATSRERLQLVLQGAELGLWDWSLPTGQVTFNERWAEMLGYRLEELEPNIATWEKLVHPDDMPAVRRHLDDHLAGRTPAYETEHRLRTGDGGWCWVLDRGKVVERDARGRPIRATGTHLDITERKHADEQRRRLEQRVQHAQKLESLGVLAGGIAHDFNNLLMGILGNANLALTRLPASFSARSNLAGIEKAARKAADLCRQLLAYSGKGRFVVERLDLSKVVREIGELLSVSVSKKATIQAELPEGLPAIEADASQVGQVVMNLITNASEAIGNEAGTITLRTGSMYCTEQYLAAGAFVVTAKPGRFVFLEVSDTGCGMSESTQRKLFDPFFTTKFMGRGLGLSAVLGIVRGHQGAIRVYSEPGRGTTVRILFPALESEATSSPSPEGGEAQGERPRSHQKVLVVDDDEIVRDTVLSMLVDLDYTPLAAANGREAVTVFRERGREIGCVLLDLTMPEMDGEECFRALREVDPNVKVVLSSGFNEEEATQRFVGRDISAFIHKPFVLADLEETLRRVLPD